MLRKLQQQFRHDFNQAGKNFSQHITSMPKLSSQQREELYFDSITECLAHGLREFYPVCEKLVGEDFFTGMAYEYIAEHPSGSPNLFDYGDQFADFVKHFAPAKELVYLSDVCKLEWAWHQAYYAEDMEILTAEVLSRIGQEESMKLIFTLSAGSTLIESAYPVEKIWRANQSGVTSDELINLDEGGVKLIVYRQDLDVVILPLSQEQWLFLQAVNQALPFAEICEQLATKVDVVKCLPWAIRHNLLSRSDAE